MKSVKEMNYFEYLKSKSLLLVTWNTINASALFVNYFKIKGSIHINQGDINEKSDLINIFTTNADSYVQRDFWPFVEFINEKEYDYYGLKNQLFNGIFYNYDLSEFIAYTLLIFIVLFFIFESKKNRKQVSE